MYICSDVAFDVRNDKISNDMELILVDILLPKIKLILFGTCYKPPSQNNFYSC